MSRQEDFIEAGIAYRMEHGKPMAIGGDNFADVANEMNRCKDFEAGAEFGYKYAKTHPNWISVEDELPKKLEGVGVSTYVLVKYGLSADKEYNVMRYNYRVNRWFDKSYKSHKNVTHWMPIVPPRNEE